MKEIWWCLHATETKLKSEFPVALYVKKCFNNVLTKFKYLKKFTAVFRKGKFFYCFITISKHLESISECHWITKIAWNFPHLTIFPAFIVSEIPIRASPKWPTLYNNLTEVLRAIFKSNLRCFSNCWCYFISLYI